MNRFYMLLSAVFVQAAVIAQSPCDTMLLTGDTMVYPGTPVRLAAQGMLEYHWSPAALFADPGLAVQTVVPDMPTTYHVTGYYQDTDIVLNGDFSMGYDHFTSDYEYVGVQNPQALFAEGTFAVGANSSSYHVYFGPYADHTTGNGNFLIVNGATRPNVTVWEQTIGVTPHTDYAFVTWLQTVCGDGDPAKLQFSINGQQLGDIFEASATPGLWQQFYEIWNSDTATRAVITILNQNTVNTGNDFGLDDISFSPIWPCTDSVHVGVVAPVAAVNDTFAVCRGDVFTADPTANDTVDSLCGTVVLRLADTPPHVAAEAAGTSVTFRFDPSYSGACDLSYAICCGGVCDTAVMHFTVGGDSSEYADTACGSYEWEGETYTVSCDTTRHFTNAAGCDSAVTLHLTVNQVYENAGDTTVCAEALPLSWHGVLFTADSVGRQVTITGATAAGCDSLWTVTVNVSKPEACFTIQPPGGLLKAGTDVTFADCSERAAGWTWLVDGTETPGGRSSGYVFADTGLHTVALVVNDIYGCTDTAVTTIQAVEPSEMYVPNSFTPNGDGLNDVFRPVCRGEVADYEMIVFDRWGRQLVFVTRETGQGWDGMQGGRLVAPGTVYNYIIMYSDCFTGQRFSLTGSVTVLY